jgi:glycosyltransferase involved in cell wall biosynthesis
MGFASKRKGTDLFVEVFKCLYKKNKNIKFCWIGEFENEQFKKEILKDIPNEILENNLIFTGSLPNSFSNYAPFDVFFLSSREDPYPLVVLEAASMRKPSICFNGSGGIPEFVGEDAGWIISDFDVEAVCDLIDNLYQNREQILAKGNAARTKVINLHGNDELVLKQFDAILNQAIR